MAGLACLRTLTLARICGSEENRMPYPRCDGVKNAVSEQDRNPSTRTVKESPPFRFKTSVRPQS